MASRKPRRAPAPGERTRDPERSKAALLDAALVEFSAKGRAGARVSAIAQRAGVDKQLITYYFGGKDGLYAALIERWLTAEDELGGGDLPLPDLVAAYVEAGQADRDLGRFLLRVALDDDQTAVDDTLYERFDGELDDLRRRQRAGEIADELDPAFVLLMLQGAASASVAFPEDVRRATGLDPASPEFAQRYAEQLRRVVRRLAD